VRYLDDDESNRLMAALNARDDRKRTERRSANQWRLQRGYELLPDLGAYCDSLTPMVILALNTGLRRGELWNLVWGDVDLKRAMLTVHGKGAKSGQTRHIPLNTAASGALKAHKGEASPLPSVPVFGRHEMKTAFGGVLKAAGIEAFRWHDLRHTFASRLVMASVPLNTVRELMGHASLDMTLIYAHLAPDNLRDAVEMLR
jgi:integrase